MARIRWGSAILSVGSLGLIAASFSIVSRDADVSTAVGRHLWAGALANASLALVLSGVAFFALRRGERWAVGAATVPLMLYGLPVLLIDATNVRSENLAATLAPQVVGVAASIVGIGLAASGVQWRSR
jgi:hypothetical protein